MKIEIDNNNYRFILDGDINYLNEDKIKKEIIDTLQKNIDYQKVYVDMKNVTFLDSSALGMLIYINRFLNSQQKTLHLTSPSSNVLKILELGAFNRLFKIEK